MSRKPFGGARISSSKPGSATAENKASALPPHISGTKRSPSETGSGDETNKRIKSFCDLPKDLESPTSPLSVKHETAEEEDTLEAFMAELKPQEPAPKEKIKIAEFEEEDELESFIKFHHDQKKQKIIDAGLDPEIKEYAEYDDEDLELLRKDAKKNIQPLPLLYHSEIEYEEFEKDFLEEHSEISSLSPTEVSNIRKELEIRVSGADVPRPITQFKHLSLDTVMTKVIDSLGYSEPTVIQKQALPVALSGRDIIGIAKTGSGKTAAFVIPLVTHIMAQREVDPGEGPIAVVLAPTRELADQIFTEAFKFSRPYGIRICPIYGGKSKLEQIKQLKNGVELVVCTPGRLMDILKLKKVINTHRVTFLVLDEADRMFDLGFEPQVRSIAQQIRPDRQTLMFSATFDKTVEAIIRDLLTDPIRISVGTVGEANEDVTQVVHVLKEESEKWPWMVQNLPFFAKNGSVIVFVSTKNAVELLSQNLSKFGFPALGLHGDKMQVERESIMRDFKSGKCKLLVATDVAARGLDIASIKTVINFDIARDIDSHTHRVGRTGRAGAQDGVAYTLFTPQNRAFARALIENLQTANQVVPEELKEFARMESRSRNSNRGDRRGGGRGRGGGGRGIRSEGDSQRSFHAEEEESHKEPSNSSSSSTPSWKPPSRHGVGFSGSISSQPEDC